MFDFDELYNIIKICIQDKPRFYDYENIKYLFILKCLFSSGAMNALISQRCAFFLFDFLYLRLSNH